MEPEHFQAGYKVSLLSFYLGRAKKISEELNIELIKECPPYAQKAIPEFIVDLERAVRWCDNLKQELFNKKEN